MAKKEIFEVPEEKIPLIEVEEKPKKAKKARAPLSDERKAQLREQLKRAREAKTAKKLGVSKVVEPVKVVVAPEPEPEPVKKVRKPRAKKEPAHPKPVPIPKDNRTQELEDLKLELSLLKESNKKKEIDELRLQVANLKKPKSAPKIEIQEKSPEPQVKVYSPPPEFKKANYSTYKKSIWAGFGDD